MTNLQEDNLTLDKVKLIEKSNLPNYIVLKKRTYSFIIIIFFVSLCVLIISLLTTLNKSSEGVPPYIWIIDSSSLVISIILIFCFRLQTIIDFEKKQFINQIIFFNKKIQKKIINFDELSYLCVSTTAKTSKSGTVLVHELIAFDKRNQKHTLHSVSVFENTSIIEIPEVSDLNKIGKYTSNIINCDFIEGNGSNKIEIKDGQITKIDKEEQLSVSVSKLIQVFFYVTIIVLLIAFIAFIINYNGPVRSILSIH